MLQCIISQISSFFSVSKVSSLEFSGRFQNKIGWPDVTVGPFIFLKSALFTRFQIFIYSSKFYFMIFSWPKWFLFFKIGCSSIVLTFISFSTDYRPKNMIKFFQMCSLWGYWAILNGSGDKMNLYVWMRAKNERLKACILMVGRPWPETLVIFVLFPCNFLHSSIGNIFRLIIGVFVYFQFVQRNL